jgi:hypothetical protein
MKIRCFNCWGLFASLLFPTFGRKLRRSRRFIQNEQTMCMLCDLSEEEKKKTPRYDNPNAFKTNLCSAPINNPCCCVLSFFFLPCAVYKVRVDALKGDMSRYVCCQGYIGKCCCFNPGHMGEQNCPAFCLCIESFCCTGLSVSSTRNLVMDERAIQPDPCDFRLICFSNVLQVMSCVCNVIAIFFRPARELAQLIRLISHLVFLSVASCMVAQVDLELRNDLSKLSGAPGAEEMTR